MTTTDKGAGRSARHRGARRRPRPSVLGRHVASVRRTVRAHRDRANGTATPARPTTWHPSRQRPRSAARQTGFVLLLGLVGVLVLVGLVMVMSASSVEALRDYGSSWLFFTRQVAWVALGVLALFLTLRVDYRRWRPWAVPVLGASAVLLVLVLGMGIGVGGARRWLGVGQFRVQPSELAKLGLLLFAADLLARRHDSVGDWRLTLVPVLAGLAAVGGLVMLQPDMGTTIVLGIVALTLLFVAGTPLGTMSTLAAGSALLAVCFAYSAPYRRARLTAFLSPWSDPGNTGYQIAQSLIGQAEGGLTGVGLGASRAKWGFLPNAHTDFIFAIIGEEAGLLGSLLVVALFVGFTTLGIRAGLRAPDRFGLLLAAGVTAWVAGQAVVNIGAVVGVLPVTGVPLPFVSFGGSSLVITMAATGMLLNVARQGR